MKDDNNIIVSVPDLGVAAFLKMNGYKVHRRKGREFFFIIKESEQEQFFDYQFEYSNSTFAAFDSEIMNLKKLPSSNMREKI